MNFKSLSINNQKDQNSFNNNTTDSFQTRTGDQPKRMEPPEPLPQSLNNSTSKQNIFNQYIANQNQIQTQIAHNEQTKTGYIQDQPAAENAGFQAGVPSARSYSNTGQFNSKNSPQAKIGHQNPHTSILQMNTNPNISNSKKSMYEKHQQFSNFGKQALAGPPKNKGTLLNQSTPIVPDQRDHLVLQKGGDAQINDDSQQHQIHKNLHHSFEESKDKFGVGQQKQTTSDSSKGHLQETGQQNQQAEKINQLNNSLNQGLLPLQPQTIKRGQRRHFPSKNDIEFMMKNMATQQKDQAEARNTKNQELPDFQRNLEQSHTKAQHSQATKSRIIRGTHFSGIQGQSIFEQDQNTQEINSATPKHRISTNPRQGYQQSIFKNRQKMAIGKQIQHQYQSSDANPEQPEFDQYFQFKSKFQGQQQTQGANLQQYGQNLFNRNSPNQGLAGQLVGQAMVQAVNQPHARKFNEQGADFSLNRGRLSQLKNPGNQKIPDQIENTHTQIRDGIFSPQPKSSSQMSQYNETTSNTHNAQKLIRKTQINHLEQLRDNEKDKQSVSRNLDDKNAILKGGQMQTEGNQWTLQVDQLSKDQRQLGSLNKTDEKQKGQGDEKMTSKTNFRKYKKTIRELKDHEQVEINVLGQPKSQYDEFQRSEKAKIAPNNASGKYVSSTSNKINLMTKRVPSNIQKQQIQTGITLPSMVSSDIPSTTAGGGPQSSIALNNTNIGSFQLSNNQQDSANQGQQTNQNSFVRKNRQQSIFSTSNFSGNITDNNILDINYNIKGSNETRRIAWEIKFNKDGGDDNQPVNPDFIYSGELQKYRPNQTKTPMIQAKQQKFSQNNTQVYQQNKTQINQGQGSTSLNNSMQTEPKHLAKLTKIPQKIQENQPIILETSISPQKKAGNITTKNGTTVFMGISGSCEVSLKASANSQSFFRRQGGVKFQNVNQTEPPKTQQKNSSKIKINIRRQTEKTKSRIKVDESKQIKPTAFKKGARTLRQQIKQTSSQLPAELIVTKYARQNEEQMVQSATIQIGSASKDKPRLQLMNFVGSTPEKVVSRRSEYQSRQKDMGGPSAFNNKTFDSNETDQSQSLVKRRVFDYQRDDQRLDQDFFQPTSNQEFDEYMEQHEQSALSISKFPTDINPSANPISSHHGSDSRFSRQSKHTQSDDIEQFQDSIAIDNSPFIKKWPNKMMQAQQILSHKSANSSQPSNTSRVIQNKPLMKESIINLNPSLNNSCSQLTSEKTVRLQREVVDQSGSLRNKGNKTRWSGGISEQTQIQFNKVVMGNKNIKEKMNILCNVGIVNESNSLFKQIVADIQKAVHNSMSHSDIVNCIKASSFGNPSALEPQSFGHYHAKAVRDEPHHKYIIPLIKQTNSGGQSRGYSQYQSQFQVESIHSKNFQKSKSHKHIPKRNQPETISRNKIAQLGQFHSLQINNDSSRNSHHLPLIKRLNTYQVESEQQNHYRNYQAQQSGYSQTPSINLNAHKKGLNYFNNAQKSCMTVGATNQLKLKKSFQSLNQHRIRQDNQGLPQEQRQIVCESKQMIQLEGLRQAKSEHLFQQQSQENAQNSDQLGIVAQKVKAGFKASPQFVKSKYNTNSSGKKVGLRGQRMGDTQPKLNQHKGIPVRSTDLTQNGPLDKQMLVPDQSYLKNPSNHPNINQSSQPALGPNFKPEILPRISVKNLLIEDSEKQQSKAHLQSDLCSEQTKKENQLIVQKQSNQPNKNINQINQKMKQRKQQIQELNQKSQSFQNNFSISSQPSYISIPSLHETTSNPKNSSSGKGKNSGSNAGEQSESCKQHSSGNNSSGYNNKYQKTKQIGRGTLMSNILTQNPGKAPLKEPIEYGIIIKWRQGEIVGLGSSSIVYSAIRVDQNTLLAVKKFKVVSDITGIDQKKLKLIKNEIQKYKQLEHDNVVKFYGCELLDQFFCIYLEQMETSLANILSEYGYFDEITIRYYTKQILKGLQYLHDQKIKHLDLKCSNILTNNDGIIKLCDFGSAREFKKGSNGTSSFTSLQSQILGSVQWMAPEVIKEEGSGSKSDIWSLGCTIVEMFVGGNPWGDKLDDQNLYLAQKTILRSEQLPQIPQSTKVSIECEDFLAKCLTRDYALRPSASELLQHKWIQQEK